MTNLINQLMKRRPDLAVCEGQILEGYKLLLESYAGGGKVLVCGNGGSAADSEHLVGELMKGFRLPRPVLEEMRRALIDKFPDRGEYLADHLQGALPAISLVSQVGLITAFANDIDPAMIFAQQVYGYGRPGDVLVALSASGNAANVLNALQVARAAGVKTLGLSGATGGQMPPLCDVLVRVPYQDVAEIQEGHIAVYHTLAAMLEEHFFSKEKELLKVNGQTYSG